MHISKVLLYSELGFSRGIFYIFVTLISVSFTYIYLSTNFTFETNKIMKNIRNILFVEDGNLEKEVS